MTAQELKNSILQLAVQGKLVPQDKNDEPASELLKRIQAEKVRLIKEGLYVVDKKHTADSIKDEDILYDLPNGWEWVRFADIASFQSGKTPQRQNTSYWGNSVPWISIADMVGGGTISTTKEMVSDKAIEECFSGKISPAGTMIMSFKLTIGKVSILGMNAVHNEAIISIYPLAYGEEKNIFQNYLFKVLPLIAETGDSKNAIKGKTLNSTSISNLLIPIPPLAEQQRIVDKIEELLPLVEEYRKAETRLKELNADFPDMLRKSILQQAVQGKLTERNPEDEPASELLKRIQAEKTKLIKESKVKKDKSLSSITEDEIPFDIPDTWQWVRLNVCTPVLNGDRGKNYPSKSTLGKEGIPFISALNLNGKTVIEDDNLLCLSQMQYDKLRNGKLNKNDIVVCIRGSLGKHGQYPFEKGAIASSLVILRPYFNPSTFAKYLMLYLDSPLFFNEIKKYDNGTAQPNLAAKSLEQFLFPLPPLEEQKRIVDRVEELLSLCDQLK